MHFVFLQDYISVKSSDGGPRTWHAVFWYLYQSDNARYTLGPNFFTSPFIIGVQWLKLVRVAKQGRL